MKKHLLFFVFTVFALTLSNPLIAQDTSKPSIKFFVGDQPIDAGGSVAVAQLPKLMIKFVPDVVQDGKYTVHWRLYIRDGSRLGQPAEGSTESLPGGFLARAKPGNSLMAEVDRVTFTDANGKRELVTVDAGMKYLSIGVVK
jgi:hypothetical protein